MKNITRKKGSSKMHQNGSKKNFITIKVEKHFEKLWKKSWNMFKKVEIFLKYKQSTPKNDAVENQDDNWFQWYIWRHYCALLPMTLVNHEQEYKHTMHESNTPVLP